jgi:hypothetical protein
VGDSPRLWVYPLLDFLAAGGIASAEATKGLSDRPLETFGAAAGWVQSGRHSPLLGNRG